MPFSFACFFLFLIQRSFPFVNNTILVLILWIKLILLAIRDLIDPNPNSRLIMELILISYFVFNMAIVRSAVRKLIQVNSRLLRRQDWLIRIRVVWINRIKLSLSWHIVCFLVSNEIQQIQVQREKPPLATKSPLPKISSAQDSPLNHNFVNLNTQL